MRSSQIKRTLKNYKRHSNVRSLTTAPWDRSWIRRGDEERSPLWNISTLDISFLSQRLLDEKFIKTSRERHKIQKNELTKILTDSKHFSEIVESNTNFILALTENGEEMFDKLLEQKILIRKCASFDYLSNNWLRFAVKDKEAHQRLKVALELLKAEHKKKSLRD